MTVPGRAGAGRRAGRPRAPGASAGRGSPAPLIAGRRSRAAGGGRRASRSAPRAACADEAPAHRDPRRRGGSSPTGPTAGEDPLLRRRRARPRGARRRRAGRDRDGGARSGAERHDTAADRGRGDAAADGRRRRTARGPRPRGPAGPRRDRFAGGESAALVAFGGRPARRWQVTTRAGRAARALRGGRRRGHRSVLYRANRVKSAVDDALVWEQYPGAPNGGTAQLRDLTPYLSAGRRRPVGPVRARVVRPQRQRLSSPRPTGTSCRVDAPDAGEEVPAPARAAASPSRSTSSRRRRTRTARAARASAPGTSTSRTAGRRIARRTGPGLLLRQPLPRPPGAAPISFCAADGDFRGGDRVLVHTDDGAARTAAPGRASTQQRQHVHAARRRSPTMQMFLFRNRGDFRDVNGGDDAAIVYHEYTHGLSDRLVTSTPAASGRSTRRRPGAMGEGWSDWYARTSSSTSSRRRHRRARARSTWATTSTRCRTRSAARRSTARSARRRPRARRAGRRAAAGFTYGDFGTRSTARAGGPRRRRDLGPDAVGPARARSASAIARADRHAGDAALAARAVVPGRARRDPARRPALFPQGDHSGAIWQVFARARDGRGRSSPAATVGGPGIRSGRRRRRWRSRRGARRRARPSTLDASASSDPDGAVAFSLGRRRRRRRRGPRPRRPADDGRVSRRRHVPPRGDALRDEGRVDTVSASGVVAPDSAPAGGGAAVAPPAAGGAPARRAPAITLRRTGTRGRIRLTVRCDAACSGTVRLTVARRLARRLGLGGTRRVGRVPVRLARGHPQLHRPPESRDPRGGAAAEPAPAARPGCRRS